MPLERPPLRIMLELNTTTSSNSSSTTSSDQSNSPGGLGHHQSNYHRADEHGSMLSMINLNLHEASKFNLFSQQSSPPPSLNAGGNMTEGSKLPEYPKLPVSSSASSSPVPCSTSNATSHYIHDILSRPASLISSSSATSGMATNTFSSALASTLPKFPLATVPSSAVCFSAAAAAVAANGISHKIGSLNDLQTRPIYWPSMMQNSNLWRERFANAGKFKSLVPTGVVLTEIFQSESKLYGKRWEKEAHKTDIFRASNLCFGKNIRTHEIPGRTRESETGVYAWNVGKSSESK